MDVISPEIITLPPLSLCFIKIKCDIVIQFLSSHHFLIPDRLQIFLYRLK